MNSEAFIKQNKTKKNVADKSGCFSILKWLLKSSLKQSLGIHSVHKTQRNTDNQGLFLTSSINTSLSVIFEANRVTNVLKNDSHQTVKYSTLYKETQNWRNRKGLSSRLKNP